MGNSIEITAKIVHKFDGNTSLKASATVYLAGCFAIHDVKVIEGKNGLFVSMPNKSYVDKQGATKYKDICHATTAEMQKKISDAVIDAYRGIGNSPAPAPEIEPPPAPPVDATPNLFNYPTLDVAPSLDDIELPFDYGDIDI